MLGEMPYKSRRMLEEMICMSPVKKNPCRMLGEMICTSPGKKNPCRMLEEMPYKSLLGEMTYKSHRMLGEMPCKSPWMLEPLASCSQI